MGSFDTWIVFHWQVDPFNHFCKMPCVVGVFDDEKKAVDACLDDQHYVFPMVMNAVHAGAPEEHPGRILPHSQLERSEPVIQPGFGRAFLLPGQDRMGRGAGGTWERGSWSFSAVQRFRIYMKSLIDTAKIM